MTVYDSPGPKSNSDLCRVGRDLCFMKFYPPGAVGIRLGKRPIAARSRAELPLKRSGACDAVEEPSGLWLAALPTGAEGGLVHCRHCFSHVAAALAARRRSRASSRSSNASSKISVLSGPGSGLGLRSRVRTSARTSGSAVN